MESIRYIYTKYKCKNHLSYFMLKLNYSNYITDYYIFIIDAQILFEINGCKYVFIRLVPSSYILTYHIIYWLQVNYVNNI